MAIIDDSNRGAPDQATAELIGPSSESTRVARFELLEPIGSGGMGELYAAYDAQLDRKIALKLVLAGRKGSKADARLLREAQALAKLSHPNVVSVYEVGRSEDRVFVAMEYVRGQTLTAWLEASRKRPEPSRVRDLLMHFRDAGRGLAAVHQSGLAHRDFKPDNVLVGDDGRVRIVDFGIARSTRGSADEPQDSNESEESKSDSLPPEIDLGSLTATGTLLGTPRFMAPEQWRARRGDSRSDQFSFCVSLYWALFERWPFESPTRQGLRVAVVGGELREPPRRPEIPPRLHAALMRGLATDPEARWPDMSELLEAIDETLAARRRPGVWLGALALTIVITVIGVLALARPPVPGLAFTAVIDRVEREMEAEQRRARVATEVEALDSKGEHADADAVFAAFVVVPQYAHTRALAHAWLDQAERLRERGDASGELAALGEAQLASSSADQRRLALMELARALVRGHRYAQLGATLTVLDEAANDEDEPSLELVDMHVREAVSRRDFTAAIAWLDYPAAEPLAVDLLGLLRQLERVSLTDHVAADIDVRLSAMAPLPSLDLDGDQRHDLLLSARNGPVQVLGSRPGLPVLDELDLPLAQLGRSLAFRPVGFASGRSGAPNWVLANITVEHSLYEVRAEAGHAIATSIATSTTLGAPGTHWVTGDLFAGEGWTGWEGFGAQTEGRRLVGLHGRDHEFQGFDPQPSLVNLASVVEDAAIADLDADGDDELIVGVGAWWAYDVRVLDPDREQPGSFDVLARRKLGALTGLITFPAPSGRGHWIAVTLPTTPPSPRVFSSEAPAEPSSVTLLSWPGPGRPLDIVDQVALPNSHRPSAGDLDGDGRSELVVQFWGSPAFAGEQFWGSPAIAVLYPAQDDRYSALWIEGLVHHAIADIDADGDDELIVSEAETGRVMVLGTGEGRMPVIDRRSAVVDEPPAELDPALGDLWTRAETLAMIGLIDQARSAFAELARLGSPSEAALADRRSAQLAERSGARQQAAMLYERAGDRDSLERAVDLYERIHGFAEAARIAERLAAQPELDEGSRERWRARKEVLHRRAEPEVALEFDFDEPLDARWRIARPGLLRREPGGLRVESVGAVDPVLLTRTIIWEGDRLEIELDLDILRFDWGSQLNIVLVPVDESGQPTPGSLIVQRAIGSFGGGDHYELNVDNGRLERESPWEPWLMQGALPPAAGHRFRLRVDLLADAEYTRSTLTTLDEDGPRDDSIAFERLALRDTLHPGRYQLRVEAGSEPWVRGVIRLERMRVLGARDDLDAPSATVRERVLLAMARGEHERALELLDSADADELDERDAAWLRALALEQLGRWPEAQPALELAIADCGEGDTLARFGHAMLLQPDRIGPVLRSICPADRFLLATWEVTRTTLFQHKDLADLHRTLTTQLLDLDHHVPADYAEAIAIMGLLTSRARGWLMQDVGPAASSDLDRVIELSTRWLATPSLTSDQQQELRRLGSIAHVELAVVQMSRDQHDAAASELDQALANDLAPEIIADLIAARPVFEPLRETSLWSRIARAQLGL